MEKLMSNNKIQEILRDPFPQSIYPQLSQLERNIAKMTVIDGMTAKEVADALGSQKSTIYAHRQNIFKALGVRHERWASMVFERIRQALGGE